eukprot:8436220-Alexandrium_andersonii.AAC.1
MIVVRGAARWVPRSRGAAALAGPSALLAALPGGATTALAAWASPTGASGTGSAAGPLPPT